MPLVPTPKNCDASVKKAIQILTQKLGLKSVPVHASLTLTDLTASSLIGTNASKVLESVTVSTGLDYTRPTLKLSHLGIQDLTDPGADRILFWDETADASKWLAVGNSIAITTTTIDTIQDIRTSASPTFAGLTLTNAAVIGSDSVVFQPNTDSTTFFQVLDADGGTPIFNVDTTNERVGIGTISPYSGLHYQGDIFYLTPAAGPESNDNITIKNYATGNGAPNIILRTADIAGAYGISVGTLSLIGGSKTTHYGGIDHGGGKISLQGGQGRDAANDPSYYAPVLLQPTGGNVGIRTTAPNAPLEVKGAKPGVVGGHQSGQLQVTGTGGEFYCAVITGHNSFNTNTQLWYLGSTSAATHDEIAFINRQNAAMHFSTNNTTRMTIGAAGNVTLTTIAAEGSDVDKFLVSSTGEIKYRTGTDVLSDIGGQTQGDVLDDLNTLGAPASDGQFIVATGAGAFAYESGATARTSLGLGTGDSPTFTNLTLDATGTISFTGNLDLVSAGDSINFRNSVANQRTTFRVMPNGTVSTAAALEFFDTDFVADAVNYERLSIQAQHTYYEIFTNKGGTGTINPLIIYTSGNTNQLYLAADGGITMATLKSGTDQANAGAAADELYHDTDDNTVKIGV